jgi:hypothetical protein
MEQEVPNGRLLLALTIIQLALQVANIVLMLA